MGTDCEIHIEIKIEGVWHHYRHDSCIDRNYELFGLMAGVRGGKAMIEPRGIPENMTIVTWSNYKHQGEDDHTHSWLSSNEIIALSKEWDKQTKGMYGLTNYMGYLFGASWQNFRYHPESYPDFLEDFRFIFWFNC